MRCCLVLQPRGVTRPTWPMLDRQVVWPDEAAAGELTTNLARYADPGGATGGEAYLPDPR